MALFLPLYRPLLRNFPRTLRTLRTPTISRALSTNPPPFFPGKKPPIPIGTIPTGTIPNFAFAFDIDGTISISSVPIPQAKTALKQIHKLGIQSIFITNGGGQSERSRAESLTRSFEVPVDSSQIIQCHTPFKDLVPNGYKTVLVIGGEEAKCRSIAQVYGFERVVLSCDILSDDPLISPFSVDPKPKYAEPLPPGDVKIDVVLVFDDSRDWALDLQLLLDVALSDRGRLKTRRPAGSVEPNIPIYFSNPDLLWPNGYGVVPPAYGFDLPRLGLGGFRTLFEAAYKAMQITYAGLPDLKCEVIGKPYATTYVYAEETLLIWWEKQMGRAGLSSLEYPVETVYMIGDNPASDIKGANDFNGKGNAEWSSILVETGLYKPGDPTFGAKKVVANALDGVSWAIQNEIKKLRKKGVEV